MVANWFRATELISCLCSGGCEHGREIFGYVHVRPYPHLQRARRPCAPRPAVMGVLCERAHLVRLARACRRQPTLRRFRARARALQRAIRRPLMDTSNFVTRLDRLEVEDRHNHLDILANSSITSAYSARSRRQARARPTAWPQPLNIFHIRLMFAVPAGAALFFADCHARTFIRTDRRLRLRATHNHRCRRHRRGLCKPVR